MATGDVTISVAVEGGVTKTVTLDSATREKSKLHFTSDMKDLSADADWQAYVVNKMATSLVSGANARIASETSYTKKTFTAAS